MLSTLLSISRPRFWFYLLGPYLIGSIAVTSTYSLFLSWEWWLWAIFWFLPANIWIYGVNDWFDRDTDARNTKKETQERRMLPQDAWIKWVFFACVVVFSFLVFQLSGLAQIWFLVWIFLGTFYSAPPLRFKTKPVLDAASNLLYAVPGFVAAWQWGGVAVPLWTILAAGAWSGAMHAFSAIPDRAPDTAAGLKTVATLFGYKGTLVFCSALWAVSAGLLIWNQPVWGWFALIYPVIPLLFIGRSELSLAQAYWRMPWVNLLSGFFLFWAIVLSRGSMNSANEMTLTLDAPSITQLQPRVGEILTNGVSPTGLQISSEHSVSFATPRAKLATDPLSFQAAVLGGVSSFLISYQEPIWLEVCQSPIVAPAQDLSGQPVPNSWLVCWLDPTHPVIVRTKTVVEPNSMKIFLAIPLFEAESVQELTRVFDSLELAGVPQL